MGWILPNNTDSNPQYTNWTFWIQLRNVICCEAVIQHGFNMFKEFRRWRLLGSFWLSALLLNSSLQNSTFEDCLRNMCLHSHWTLHQEFCDNPLNRDGHNSPLRRARQTCLQKTLAWKRWTGQSQGSQALENQGWLGKRAISLCFQIAPSLGLSIWATRTFFFNNRTSWKIPRLGFHAKQATLCRDEEVLHYVIPWKPSLGNPACVWQCFLLIREVCVSLLAHERKE